MDPSSDSDYDIYNLQWSATNDDFEILFDDLEAKYLSESNSHVLKEEEKAALETFFSYFRKVWGPASPIHRWFEGAHPYHVRFA